jgi:hypothetical protein
MKAQMKNNAVSQPPVSPFAQPSNYITSVLLSVGTAKVCHYSLPSSQPISLLQNCLTHAFLLLFPCINVAKTHYFFQPI